MASTKSTARKPKTQPKSQASSQLSAAITIGMLLDEPGVPSTIRAALINALDEAGEASGHPNSMRMIGEPSRFNVVEIAQMFSRAVPETDDWPEVIG